MGLVSEMSILHMVDILCHKTTQFMLQIDEAYCYFEHCFDNLPFECSVPANESTQRRLLAYTIGEYALLVAASVGQVYMIRHLFSKRIGYNRV
jgi:hypothetical protein